MSPALQMFMTPMIGLVCFAIILAELVRRGEVFPQAFRRVWWPSRRAPYRLGVHRVGPEFRRHEPGGSRRIGRQFRLPRAVPGRRRACSAAFEFLGVILVTAIPFGIYDLVEAMDNVESASAAGDTYPTTRVLTADGVVSLIGCLMGNPFINAVYIGHPGWKSMGGRIGYSAATGLTVIVLCWFGAFR